VRKSTFNSEHTAADGKCRFRCGILGYHMLNITRDNHYVSQASLRRWSCDGTSVYASRLLVSRAQVPEWELSSIRGIAFQENLYTTFSGGHEADEFEKWITTDYEEPGLEAVDKLIKRARLTPSDWKCMARFVAAQDVRTPLNYIESMQRWSQQIPETVDKCVDDAVEKWSRARTAGIPLDCSKPKRNEFADSFRVQIDPPNESNSDQKNVRIEVSVGRNLWIASMRHLLTGAANILCQHRWSVLEPDGDCEWPLTDHPVLRLNYYQPGHYDFCGGWGNEGSEIIMPVSPQHVLYVQVGHKTPNRVALSRSKTELLQRLIVERAHRWVFARKPAPWVAQVRPRIIDQAAFMAEQAAWKNWHETHLRAEAGLD
jgi:Protein of unknown function (DUF4238)